MMTAKKCDRCGALYEDNAKGKTIVGVMPITADCERLFDNVVRDLCPKCVAKFTKWMKQEVEQNDSETV